MVWGILEDKHMDHVPGTVLLADTGDVPSAYRAIPRELLKHGRGKNRDIILVPQPSDSPNDPLNWPTWRKDVILAVVCLSTALVGAWTSWMTPGFVKIAADLDVTISELSRLLTWNLLSLPVSLFIFNPIAKKIGKRPVYVFALTVLFTASFIGAFSQNYETLLAARVYSSLGMAPGEFLVQSTIADIYFVHERATRVAIWYAFFLAGLTGSPLIAGYIIENQGWKWDLIWCAILFGTLLLLVIFFVPETAYRRRPYQERPPVALTEDSKPSSEKNPTAVEQHEKVLVPEMGVRVEPKDSLLRSLRLYNGFYTETPMWKIFIRPLVILWYPSVFWGFVIYGFISTTFVVFGVATAAIFAAPPYSFSIPQIGLVNLSPFILSLVGETIAGPLNDWFCLRLATKNRGVYEPEFRLPPIIISFILTVTGYFGVATTVHYQTHWSGPVLSIGLVYMGLTFCTASVFGYIIDAHIELKEEAFVALNSRNFLTAVLVFYVNDWLDRDGILVVFSVLGGIFVGISFLTIPLWIFGKRTRGYIARNKALQRFMHEG